MAPATSATSASASASCRRRTVVHPPPSVGAEGARTLRPYAMARTRPGSSGRVDSVERTPAGVRDQRSLWLCNGRAGPVPVNLLRYRCVSAPQSWVRASGGRRFQTREGGKDGLGGLVHSRGVELDVLRC